MVGSVSRDQCPGISVPGSVSRARVPGSVSRDQCPGPGSRDQCPGISVPGPGPGISVPGSVSRDQCPGPGSRDQCPGISVSYFTAASIWSSGISESLSVSVLNCNSIACNVSHSNKRNILICYGIIGVMSSRMNCPRASEITAVMYRRFSHSPHNVSTWLLQRPSLESVIDNYT